MTERLMIRQVQSPEDLHAVRRLMRDYGRFLVTNPCGAVNICLVGYEQEIEALPGEYAAPDGALLLAAYDDQPAGCVALHSIRTKVAAKSERACEMKRLWIDDGFRGLGLGRRLVEAGLAWAREAGYSAIYLDTVPKAMPEAERLYRRFGFLEVPRYNDNPVADIVFFRLALTPPEQS